MRFIVFSLAATTGIALLMGGSEARAQEDCARLTEMASSPRGNQFTENLDKNFACLLAALTELKANNEALSNKVEELEARPISGASPTSAVPIGAVLASTVTCENLGKDWTPYYPAAGRFVIGAGQHADDENKRNSDINDVDLSVYEGPGDLSWETLRHPAASNLSDKTRAGGAETHLLNVTELPAHSHGLYLSLAEGSTRPLFWANDSQALNAVASDSPLDEAKVPIQGGSQAHNNMPPYIALHYCKKE